MSRREQLERMLSADPEDLFLKYATAMACASEGDLTAAEQRLAAITAQHPDYVAAWFQRGKLLAQMGDGESAKAVIISGISAASRTGDVHAEGEMREFLDLL